MTMDEDDYNAMVAAEKAHEKEIEDRRQRRREEEQDAWRYARDD
jgi:hypothetical protein